MKERDRKGGLQGFQPTGQGNMRVAREKWENGGKGGIEHQRNKGRKKLEADFQFFENRTASYLNDHIDI